MGFFYLIGCCGAEAWDYTGINLGMLDLIGKGYIVDHCVSLFNSRAKERLYQTYITDTLKCLNDNLAKVIGGTSIKARYYDLLEAGSQKESEKTGDEIAIEIIRKAGLKVKGKEDGQCP